jgi:hypothetical protein
MSGIYFNMPRFKQTAYVIPLNDLSILYQVSKFGYKRRDILKERLLATPAGFMFLKNHFMFHLIDENISKLVSSGIIDHLFEQIKGNCSTPFIEDEWEPYVFVLNDLLFGFYIWLVACGFCLTVMTLELSWFYTKLMILNVVQSMVSMHYILKRLQKGFVM